MMFVPNLCSSIYLMALLYASWFSGIPALESDTDKSQPFQVYGQNRTEFLSCTDRRTSKTAIKPLEMIMQAPWIPKLKDAVAKITSASYQENVNPRKQVTVVFGDAKYALSLLNWLVSALVISNPPLKNIIVISLDEKLQALLDKKDITSVYVEPETVTCRPINRKTSRVWITRCVVYRLLNRWGYDVMAYDADAIVLKNLQDVLNTFGESDIIGSSGVFPFNLGAEWGQTLCMGVVLFKSTGKTERLWNAVSQHLGNLQKFDDQVAINRALYNCDIKWSNATSSQVITGQCAESEDKLQGLKITILPTSLICRKCFKAHKNSIYVWHKHSRKTGASKIKAAAITDTWYLKNITLKMMITENEEEGGINWIRAIATV